MDFAADPGVRTQARDNNFNFLRLLFASLVILSHSAELTDGDRHREILWRIFHTVTFGEVAVDGFFLLSGYLILQSWLRQPALIPFLQKRALRIVPAFVVAYVISGLIVGPLAAQPTEYFWRFQPTSFVVALVSLREPVVPPVFAGMSWAAVNGSLWTISHEFRCYLWVPILAWLGLARFRAGWLVMTLALLVAWRLGPPFPNAFMDGRFWRHFLPDIPGETLRLLTFFCVGGGYYLFQSSLRYGPGLGAGMALLLVAGLCQVWTAEIALASAGTYLLFWFAFARVPALDFFKTSPDVSYGVYLYGWPVQSLLIWHVPGLSPWIVFVITLTICLGLGWASWQWIEAPFLRLKPRVLAPRPAA